MGGDFAGPHGEVNAGGKNGVHETGGIAHAEQAIAHETAIVITEIGGGLDGVDGTGVFHAFLNGGTGVHPMMESLLGS